jgi:hypothetical protein
MLTTTRTIRSGRVIPAVRAQLTSLFARGARTSEPADGWFTLQPEPGHREASEPVTITELRGEAVDQSPERARASSAVRIQGTERDKRDHTIVHAITPVRRWLFAAIALMGATGRRSDRRRQLPGHERSTADRRPATQLAAQRDQALVTARQAQSGEAAWRTQAHLPGGHARS